MTKLIKLSFLAAVLGLSACDNDDSAVGPDNQRPVTPPPPTSQVQIIHASPDAPAVNVTLDGVQGLGAHISEYGYLLGSGRRYSARGYNAGYRPG